MTVENTVLLFTEDYYNETTDELERNMQVYQITDNCQPFIGILRRFPFKGPKSLRQFLEKFREEIIQAIPAEEEEILDQLERQKFLDYLDAKWFEVVPDAMEPIDMERILRLALKYDAVSDALARKYLLEKRKEYTYSIRDLDLVDLSVSPSSVPSSPRLGAISSGITAS